MNTHDTTSEAVTYCARHPKEETGITCATCGTPICPKCMVVTPVGMKCPDCGKNANSALFQIGIGRLLLAVVVAMVAGLIASIVGEFGLLVIFLGIPYGYFVGSLILKTVGMKRGTKLEIATGVGVLLGALLVALPPVLATGNLALLVQRNSIMSWLAVAVTAGAAISKIRNL